MSRLLSAVAASTALFFGTSTAFAQRAPSSPPVVFTPTSTEVVPWTVAQRNLTDALRRADSAEWWVAGPREILPFAGSWREIDGIVEFEKQLGATKRYDKIEIRRYLVSGNEVIAVFLGEGVVRATGKPFRGEIVRVYSFSADKVVRVRNYYDTHAYVRAVRGEP